MMEFNRINIIFCWVFFSLIILSSCSGVSDNVQLRRFTGKYKKLAQAVKKEDIFAIKNIVNEGELDVNFQEPELGWSLLIWAVENNKYNSCKTLLDLGANPNLKTFNNKTSALMFSADNYETSDYLRLLLEYGGNANDSSEFQGPNYHRTPLIAASRTRLESVKMLMEKGAIVDYMSPYHKTALRASIDSRYINIARYLMIEKGADFKKPLGTRLNGDTIYVINSLRRCVFPLDSKDYEIKMEIVDYMLEKGVNYWEAPIPAHYYKNYDSIYLSRY